MADHKHGVFEFRQVVFEPCHSVEVKVVGRFVEQQVVGVAVERFGQEHAHLLVGAHVLHKHIVLVFLNAKTGEQSGGISLGVPALEFGELLLQLAGPHAVGIAEIRLCIKGIFLFHYIPQHSVALQYSVEYRTLVEFEVVLLKHAHTFARALHHVAVGGAELSAEYAHKRRLAGAVGSYDAIAVAGGEFQVYVLKQNSFAELNT